MTPYPLGNEMRAVVHDLIRGLYSVYLDNGRVLNNRQIACAVETRFGYRPSRSQVLKVLRGAGYDTRVAKSGRPRLTDRVAERDLLDVLRLYSAGEIGIKKAMTRLRCGAGTVLVYLDAYGLPRRRSLDG